MTAFVSGKLKTSVRVPSASQMLLWSSCCSLKITIYIYMSQHDSGLEFCKIWSLITWWAHQAHQVMSHWNIKIIFPITRTQHELIGHNNFFQCTNASIPNVSIPILMPAYLLQCPWNALPSEVVSETVNSFKNSLDKHWAKNPQMSEQTAWHSNHRCCA